jgi:capsular polysaccharide biosynthesis protein
VLNEDAFAARLDKAGYWRVTLGGMELREQIALFTNATQVLAPHGAGLASIVFAPPGGSLIEIFPPTYGTAAYYVLAASGGIAYASYVTTDVARGGRDQLDDIRVDLDDVLARFEAAG